jgi:protein SCO1
MNETASTPRPSPTPNSTVQWLIWAILVLILIGIVGAGIWKQTHERTVKALPVFGRILDFEFIEKSGKPFSSKDLKGKVWIADFIFTRCAGPCPLMSYKMSQLQTALNGNPNVKLVTFSVDPAYDSPEVLRDYAKVFKANEGQWFFLTGKLEDIHKIARESFKVNAERNANSEGNIQNEILHSTHFILIDTKGNIRGYYDSAEEGVLERLKIDAERLIKEK